MESLGLSRDDEEGPESLGTTLQETDLDSEPDTDDEAGFRV